MRKLIFHCVPFPRAYTLCHRRCLHTRNVEEESSSTSVRTYSRDQYPRRTATSVGHFPGADIAEWRIFMTHDVVKRPARKIKNNWLRSVYRYILYFHARADWTQEVAVHLFSSCLQLVSPLPLDPGYIVHQRCIVSVLYVVRTTPIATRRQRICIAP